MERFRPRGARYLEAEETKFVSKFLPENLTVAVRTAKKPRSTIKVDREQCYGFIILTNTDNPGNKPALKDASPAAEMKDRFSCLTYSLARQQQRPYLY